MTDDDDEKELKNLLKYSPLPQKNKTCRAGESRNSETASREHGMRYHCVTHGHAVSISPKQLIECLYDP